MNSLIELAPILGHIGDGNFHALLQFDPNDASTLNRAEGLAKRLAEYIYKKCFYRTSFTK
jgi:FAD linked oxidases, C-terminal domain